MGRIEHQRKEIEDPRALRWEAKRLTFQAQRLPDTEREARLRQIRDLERRVEYLERRADEESHFLQTDEREEITLC